MATFVFLHGGGQGSWVWEQTIAALDRQTGGRATCLALDAPGCGAKRGVDTSGYSFEDITRELLSDIAAAGLSDIILVGHSQAGLHVPHMARLALEGLIRRLVYVSCSAPWPGMTILDQMGRGARCSSVDEVGYPLGDDASLQDRFRAMFCNDMEAGEADAFLARLGKDGWPASAYSYDAFQYDHLPPIASTFVLALRDEALPLVWQERFADRLHARDLVRIDAGHQVMNTRPEALAEELIRLARR